ncbi:MAG TPA: flagellar biosynthesis protein FlhB [Xanthobacteraceae bacterium]
MAEFENDAERTEDPTSKRLEEAIERGDVAKSIEVNTLFMLAGSTLALFAFGGFAATELTNALGAVLAGSYTVKEADFSYAQLGETLLVKALIAVAPVLAILIGAALAGNFVQHRFLWTFQPLMPQLSRISPIAGAKRLFSKQAAVGLGKGFAKLAVVGAVMYLVAAPELDRILLFTGGDLLQAMSAAMTLVLRLLVGVCAVMALVAALDWLWMYHSWYERHRMSVRDIREEHKQTEGDPTVKAKLRQIRVARMRKRMMTEVPKATVVITNPTHFAIALKYESGMNAPLCVAKGMDVLALRIREIALENRVPVVENAPLARALHKSIEIDEEVPAEHYKAVAEVIGYVLRLRRSFRP